MPSPSFDPWLASRRFGIVIDAGSSGSRLQIYSWRDARAVRYEEGQSVLDRLPKIEKGAQKSDDWISKVEPGISSFGENPEGIVSYLVPLLEHAQSIIPPSRQSETPLFLMATAGMRLLPSEQQEAVLRAACDFFRFHSHFKLDGPSHQGPCGSSIRVISGEEEGLFGWIAVNYLMDGFGHADESATYGFLDMGGASTQIAFEPSEEERKRHADDLIPVRLRLLNGNEIHHEVFVTTWLGYGTNQARERYVGQTVTAYEAQRSSTGDNDDELVPDPCLPVGLIVTETPVHTGPSTAHSRKAHKLIGTGSFEQCLKQTAPLLNKNAPCLEAPCLFNGIHVPSINFSASHFIGVSEYWYSSEHVFGLGGAYDVVQYEQAASHFCSRTWDDLVHQHEASRASGHIGGDGEVSSGGQIVGVGHWGKGLELSRLKMQCFKASWIVNVLHEGLGLPRIVDPGGNQTVGGADAKQKADQKGLGRPIFQSADTVGDTAISWPLGKIVLEASQEVPAVSASIPPLHDPLDTSVAGGGESTTTSGKTPPLLDFDRFEDHISHHLPPSLTRHSLGISPFALLFYFTVFSIFAFILYRLRYRVRTTIRRLSRGSFKRERPEVLFDAYGLEENKIGGGTSRPSTPFSSSPPSPTGTGPTTAVVRPGSGTSVRKFLPFRHSNSPPGRVSPRGNANPFPQGPTTAYNQGSRSGTSTPTAFEDDSHLPVGPPSHPLGSLTPSRSQNSSQLSLTTLVPRTVPYSRSSQQVVYP
ncbi:nucleoside phosphatase family-domain-containing protein [Hysterangium stoloniferum]|nr:nucleoside phosphatase family-domain-containing protein [Hysterangium stoloniferum]